MTAAASAALGKALRKGRIPACSGEEEEVGGGEEEEEEREERSGPGSMERGEEDREEERRRRRACDGLMARASVSHRRACEAEASAIRLYGRMESIEKRERQVLSLTCFTGTKVQILTLERGRSSADEERRSAPLLPAGN
jgi:hypothetical protein